MNTDITFHYPPELMNLLIDTIPLLNRSKKDVFLFFQGAGVSSGLMKQPYQQWHEDRNSISKFEIVRQILTKLNERGEACLRERREVLKRVIGFEDFTPCWEADRLKAQGLVSRISAVVNVKDSFTRINMEREQEREQRQAEARRKREQEEKRAKEITVILEKLLALFNEDNKQGRGKALEPLLNSLFNTYGILVRDAFTLSGEPGEGIIEQIDGVIELDGQLYLAEMKWWNKPIGKPEVSQSLVSIYHRGQSRGIFISASEYTDPAIAVVKEALQRTVVVLCTLREIVLLLERGLDLKDFLKVKIQCAITEKNPFFDPIGSGKIYNRREMV